MRRKNVISRFATFVLATLICLILAVLVPMIFGPRAIDEPFAGYGVMASPRDVHVVTAPIRLSTAPDLTLSRGTLYADGNAAAGTPISRFVLDAPVFNLNASGLHPDGGDIENSLESALLEAVAPALVDQLQGMGFDTLTVRQGTLLVTAADGTSETIGEVDAELTGRRKGEVAGHGSFTFRGQRLAFDGALIQPGDKPFAARWPMKLTLKGDLLQASFDGRLAVAHDLRAASHR